MLNLKFNRPETTEEVQGIVTAREQTQETEQKTGQMLPYGNEEEFSQGSPEHSTNDAPSHFDDLIAEEEPQGAGAILAENGAVLSEDDFHKVFVLCFTVSHNVTKLNSLKVEDGDGSARNCSKAIYDTILEIPALHFLLNPSGKWGQRAFMIGSFALPMAMNVRTEIAARNVRPRQGQAQPEQKANIAPSDMLSKFA